MRTQQLEESIASIEALILSAVQHPLFIIPPVSSFMKKLQEILDKTKE
jgi:hypothetical protein